MIRSLKTRKARLYLALVLGALVVDGFALFPRVGPAQAHRHHTLVRMAVRRLPARREAVRYRPVGCERSRKLVAYRGGPARREVALSFDDGPYPLTPRFARMLKDAHAVATFFVIGSQLGGFSATLREELRNGDVIGDHTFTHADLVRSGDVRGQLLSTLNEIRRLSGYTPCLFRPPYGDYNASIIRAAASLHLTTIMWNVDPADWALPGVAAIERRVLAQVKPGSIILSHDGGGPRWQTLAAYPYIIRKLRERGYRLVTIPQLLGLRQIYRRCVKLCGQAAITERPPPGSIIEGG
jgi:peptidoglycan-N-acetylglucosamine deacetylase